MRDLVALSALPAVWAGYQPRQVAEGLADALLSTLRLDLVYLRLPGQTEGQEIEIARTSGRPIPTDETRHIGRALAPFLDDGTADSAPSILNPAGGGTVRLVIVRIGYDREDGVLVAGSRQTGFPSEADRLLLTVGANQAAAVLQRQRAEEALRESEERFRFLVQNSSDIISLFDAEGTVLYQAPSVERLLGRRPQDRIGRNVFREPLVHPDDMVAMRAFFDAILSRAGAPVKAEFRLRHADGSWRDIEAVGQNFLHDPSVAGIVANYRDITDRKRDRALLDGQKRILELIIQGEPLVDVLAVLCRTIEDLTEAEMLASVLLLDADGVHLRHGAAPSLPESYTRAIDGSAIGPSAGSCGTGAHRREPVFVSDIATDPLWAPYADLALSHGLRACWSSPILSSTGGVLGTFAMYYRQPRDPTARDLRVVDIVTRTVAIAIERSRAEQALRESEERFRTLAKATNDAVWDWDLATNRVWWSEGVFSLFGYVLEQNEADPAWWLERVHPEDREAVETFFFGVVHGRELSWVDEYRFRCADGSYKDVYDRGHVIRDGDGRAVRMIGAMLDITVRKRAQEALRASEQRFRTFVDHATDAFFLFDEKNIVLDVNRQACESLGYTREELLGMTPIDFDPDVTPARLDEINRKLDDGQLMAFESRHRRKDGTVFPVEIRGQTFWEGGRRFTVALARDNTERKRTEAAMRESEQRFRGTFENAAVGIAHIDFEGHWLRVNQRLCDIVGRTREEMLQTTFQEITYAEDLSVSFEQFIPFTRGELSNYAFQKRYVRKDGSLVWVEIFGALQRDAAGKPVYAIAVIQDISERKRLEGELRESEHRWRSLTEALPQLVWTAMPDGACDYFSTQWTQHTGVPQNELLGWRWLQTLHPDDREPTRKAWLAAVQGPGAYDVEYRVRRSDGEYRWFKTRGVPIRDSEGGIFKWFGTCTDITAGKRLEEELRQANSRLDLSVRSSNLAIWELDIPDGVIEHASVHDVNAAEQLGYERADRPTTYAEWMALIHPDDAERIQRAVKAYLDGETREYEMEYRVRHRDGAYRWVLSRGVVVRDAAGKPILCSGSRIDITDRKRAEDQLRQLKEAAEAANRAKDEFLANVSHEIRTPMNAILGMTELVLDTPLADDQRQSLKTVKSAADNLLGIINDLLDFSKIEAGKLVLDPGDFSLRSAVGDTLRALAMRAHRKGLELVCNVQADVPDALIGDAGRLRQVLLNLVGNAIKFTESGEVVVRVDGASAEPAPDGDVNLRFTVRDTGVGIPREKQSTIFRAFEQEDTSTTRKYGGTGLGLTISAQLVELMGGSIAVESQVSRGSTFSFTALFGRQAHQPSAVFAAPPPVLLHNLRVLVVDDNAANRHIMEQWLSDWQMEPTAVGDGMAAMDALWHGVAVRRPHALILLDARMPDTDGLMLAAKIRERAELSGSRIVLLTSGDRPGDLARFRELHVDGHLLKPVQQDELLETIYSIMSRTSGDASAPTPTRPGPFPPGPAQVALPAVAPLRILVAEDSEFNAQLMEKLLVKRGHAVGVVGNGRKALTLASAADFDLLLLDVHMPELDGFQVIRAIRERERTSRSHLPVIALTARSRREDRERCLAAGMDDFLAKPIQTGDLWATIDRVLAASQSVDRRHLGLLDAPVLLSACGGDGEILRSICEGFRASLPDQLAAIRDALESDNASRLRESAHKLCGMVSAFSTLAGSMASDLEDYAARGQLEEAKPLVGQIQSAAHELMRLVSHDLTIERLRNEAEVVES